MDNKQFIVSLSERTNLSSKDTGTTINILCDLITKHLKNLDAVAIPTLGKFAAIKEDEKISKDLSTGKRLLLPPVINIVFTPASTLVKSLDK